MSDSLFNSHLFVQFKICLGYIYKDKVELYCSDAVKSLMLNY